MKKGNIRIFHGRGSYQLTVRTLTYVLTSIDTVSNQVDTATKRAVTPTNAMASTKDPTAPVAPAVPLAKTPEAAEAPPPPPPQAPPQGQVVTQYYSNCC